MHPRKGKPYGDLYEISKRQRDALEMYRFGIPYADISKALGYGHANSARAAVLAGAKKDHLDDQIQGERARASSEWNANIVAIRMMMLGMEWQKIADYLCDGDIDECIYRLESFCNNIGGLFHE